MVPLAVGSQTGGSTILPAAFCGVVGYKASLTGIDRGGIRVSITAGLFVLGPYASLAIAVALAWGFNRGRAFVIAASLLCAAPVVLLYLVFQRYLVDGLTAGGVK